MSYALSTPRSGRQLIGLAVVAALHVVLGWALMSGLARHVIDVVKAPIETRLIEEIKPPPPPPERLPPPPKNVVPPPSFVPPPEVTVTPPPVAQPTITTTAVAPPPAPVTFSTADGTARPGGRPATIDVNSCERPAYPAAASRAEVTGLTKIRFTIDADGRVVTADIERSAGASREHRQLDRAAVDALSRCRFRPGTDESGRAIGAFAVVEYVWRLE